MIDPKKFEQLSEEMRRTADRALELAQDSQQRQAVALKARKEAADAAARWREYCAEAANLSEMPDMFLLGI